MVQNRQNNTCTCKCSNCAVMGQHNQCSRVGNDLCKKYAPSCYCVCHSAVSSCPGCIHCRPEWFNADGTPKKYDHNNDQTNLTDEERQFAKWFEEVIFALFGDLFEIAAKEHYDENKLNNDEGAAINKFGNIFYRKMLDDRKAQIARLKKHALHGDLRTDKMFGHGEFVSMAVIESILDSDWQAEVDKMLKEIDGYE